VRAKGRLKRGGGFSEGVTLAIKFIAAYQVQFSGLLIMMTIIAMMWSYLSLSVLLIC